jgi:hypothetical protein
VSATDKQKRDGGICGENFRRAEHRIEFMCPAEIAGITHHKAICQRPRLTQSVISPWGRCNQSGIGPIMNDRDRLRRGALLNQQFRHARTYRHIDVRDPQ